MSAVSARRSANEEDDDDDDDATGNEAAGQTKSVGERRVAQLQVRPMFASTSIHPLCLMERKWTKAALASAA